MPASCAGVFLPCFVVSPYWNQAEVATPRGSTLPFKAAPTGVISVVAPVVGTGAAALADPAVSSRPSRAKTIAKGGVRLNAGIGRASQVRFRSGLEPGRAAIVAAWRVV